MSTYLDETTRLDETATSPRTSTAPRQPNYPSPNSQLSPALSPPPCTIDRKTRSTRVGTGPYLWGSRVSSPRIEGGRRTTNPRARHTIGAAIPSGGRYLPPPHTGLRGWGLQSDPTHDHSGPRSGDSQSFPSWPGRGSMEGGGVFEGRVVRGA